MKKLALIYGFSFALAGSALGERLGAIDVMNGAEPAVSKLNIASCDTPDVRRNLLEHGETIATGSHRVFAVAPGCWIVSIDEGAAPMRLEVTAGGTEHYTLMES
jgi:hypothetical protein